MLTCPDCGARHSSSFHVCPVGSSRLRVGRVEFGPPTPPRKLVVRVPPPPEPIRIYPNPYAGEPMPAFDVHTESSTVLTVALPAGLEISTKVRPTRVGNSTDVGNFRSLELRITSNRSDDHLTTLAELVENLSAAVAAARAEHRG